MFLMPFNPRFLSIKNRQKFKFRLSELDFNSVQDDEEFDFDSSERHGRRHRTVNPLCTDRSGLE